MADQFYVEDYDLSILAMLVKLIFQCLPLWAESPIDVLAEMTM